MACICAYIRTRIPKESLVGKLTSELKEDPNIFYTQNTICGIWGKICKKRLLDFKHKAHRMGNVYSVYGWILSLSTCMVPILYLES